MPYTLTVLDTTGIQDYIFGSNLLRENVGASELVERAATAWPHELLDQIGRHNHTGGRPPYDDSLRIEDPQQGLAAEVVYAGGGNTVIIFAEAEQARRFADLYSRRLLEEAPGLEAAIAHCDTLDWSQPDGFAAALEEAMQALARQKGTRPLSLPLLGLGVTATCRATGLPAVTYDPSKEEAGNYRPVAAEVAAKALAFRQPETARRLDEYVKPIYDAGFKVPMRFEDFGGTPGESSYIAVVHADGNSMARRFLGLARKMGGCRQGVLALRHLSYAVSEAGQQALQAMVRRLMAVRDPDEKLGGIVTAEKFIPFRPLVYGGDDVTFVCEGRLGLTLAAGYLEEFEAAFNRTVAPYRNELGQVGAAAPARACAGVAVVKTHYPFARAYALAADLCAEAKDYVRKSTDGEDFSALDWHFATGGLYGRIRQIRRREFRRPNGACLEMRPVRLREGTARDWRTWPRFKDVVEQLKGVKYWRERRNKVIGLREPLRSGPDAVAMYRLAYSLEPLPGFGPGQDYLSTHGWDSDGPTARCGYFDAIEALDFYIPLKPAPAADGAPQMEVTHG